MMQALLLVALGSALGGVARFWCSRLVARRVGERFPWGTLAVNASGAFVVGLIAGVTARGGVFATPAAWQLAVIGFLGSYTTVSSFSLETLALARGGKLWRAGGNVLLSLALCLGAVSLGVAVSGGG